MRRNRRASRPCRARKVRAADGPSAIWQRAISLLVGTAFFLGALTDWTTPNQIIGVLAHESGHIAGGHLARMREQLANAQTAAIIAMILSAGAIVAGAQSRDNSMGQAAPGIMMAPQETIR